mmetsp:Transcript_118699/g.383281  ORF Transcript_118699/g.383281 Transcript_118699/m.383281 type:complete len:268 (+) Transcript_118699:115-918(+)
MPPHPWLAPRRQLPGGSCARLWDRRTQAPAQRPSPAVWRRQRLRGSHPAFLANAGGFPWRAHAEARKRDLGQVAALLIARPGGSEGRVRAPMLADPQRPQATTVLVLAIGHQEAPPRSCRRSAAPLPAAGAAAEAAAAAAAALAAPVARAAGCGRAGPAAPAPGRVPHGRPRSRQRTRGALKTLGSVAKTRRAIAKGCPGPPTAVSRCATSGCGGRSAGAAGTKSRAPRAPAAAAPLVPRRTGPSLSRPPPASRRRPAAPATATPWS